MNQMQPSYLAHELRAPITSIRLGLEILKEQTSGRLCADERRVLDLAVRNTVRLESLVNDIMEYSKIKAGKMTVNKTECDAWMLVGEAVGCMSAMAAAQGVRLIKEANEPLPLIRADGGRIVQVLTNLISNAIKFTPPGGTVTVSIEPGGDEHEGSLIFRVKDTGKGIPTENLESIFAAFESSGRTKGIEGTGLGLALSRQFIELHGGRLWAESWRRLGATFCFTVPIQEAQQASSTRSRIEYSGLLVDLARRVHAFLALFV